MKRVFLTTAFIAFALSSQAFAVDMDYNSDTNATTDNNISVNSGSMPDNIRTTTRKTTRKMKHYHHKKTNSRPYMSNGHHTNAGPVPSRSRYMNDNATSQQGMPSGEVNGPVNGQSDDQNYGQPMNH